VYNKRERQLVFLFFINLVTLTFKSQLMLHRFYLLALALCISSILLCQENTYDVYALKFGSRNGKIAISDIAVGSKSKDSTEVYFMIWLLKGTNGKTILVDAGFTDTDQKVSFVRPDKVLAEINVRPEDITDIIITHPHWDHIGGIDLFPKAKFWMQEEDYNYFVGAAWQKEGNNAGFKKIDVLKIIQKNIDDRLILVKGEGKEIIPGIKIFTGSKHTYQSQYPLVNTSTGKVIIASDNCKYYYNLINELPSPYTFDLKAYLNNIKKMKTMVSKVDYIIPGHDPLVFSKFKKVADDVVKISD
jgi:glyoxylase-like metal-dependent hydrolase (beta-lactamase superfamily II)